MIDCVTDTIIDLNIYVISLLNYQIIKGDSDAH